MLARVAETLYWIGRYHERAENTARLLKVNTNLSLDLPRDLFPLWEPMIDILGCRQEYQQRHPHYTERRIINFLICDEASPSSIITSLARARENARSIREILPREGWEAINLSWQHASDHKAGCLSRSDRQTYLERIMSDVQRITGVLAGSMNHDTAYDFLNLGRKIERADMTTRIIDVRSDTVIPATFTELKPFGDMVCMNILKSLSGYQMYRQTMQVRVRREDVFDFLLHYRMFPRSLAYCTSNIQRYLSNLPNSEAAIKRLKQINRSVARGNLKNLDQAALHRFLDRLQLQLGQLHDDIARTWFPQLSA